MRDFNRDRRSGGGGGGRDFGNRGFGNRDRGERQMFDATCSNCGKACQVPFRPSNGKPVLCNDCFRSQPGGEARYSSDRGPRRENNDRGNFGGGRPAESVSYKEQFEALNNKLDKIMKMLEYRPSTRSASTPTPTKHESTPETIEVKDENVVREEDMQLVPSEETPIVKKKRTVKKKTPVKTEATEEIEVVEAENIPIETTSEPEITS